MERYEPAPCWNSHDRHSAARAAPLFIPPNTPRFCAGGVLRGTSRFPNRSPPCCICGRICSGLGREIFCRTLDSVLVAQPLIRVRHAFAVRHIVRPHRGAADIADVPAIEVVPVDERIVHDHRAVTPSGMPTPSAPAVPAGAEEEAYVDRSAESEVQARRSGKSAAATTIEDRGTTIGGPQIHVGSYTGT